MNEKAKKGLGWLETILRLATLSQLRGTHRYAENGGL